jgi:metal-responsive CopG/Arc/MetJ family transcriptional regulator
MPTIAIEIEDALAEQLTAVAEERGLTVGDLIRKALNSYVAAQRSQTMRYSFIGIGNSGKGNISTQVDETVARGANRCEGWGL